MFDVVNLSGGVSSLDKHNQSNHFVYDFCLCSPRTLRGRKQQSSSGSLSLSLSQAATPRKTLSFSAVSTPINNSSSIQQSHTASEAYMLTPILDQSSLRQRTITTTTTTTSVDGHCGQLLKM